MTEKEMLLKIIELQDEIIKLKNNAYFPSQIQQIFVPEKFNNHPCLNGVHDYPSPWFGITPPVCRKCGYIMEAPSVTCSSGVNIGQST